MAGAVLNRQLTATRPSRIRFDVATERDDADIRRLLRENPMPGHISISLEREPNYFADSDLPDEEKQTIVAREDGRVICVGNCSIRERFVNGQPRRVGYLGGLRLDARVAGRFDILRDGYQFFRELQANAPADFYFTSIAVENLRARDFLERGLPGMPVYKFIGDFVTLLLPVSESPRANFTADTLRIESKSAIPDLVSFINDHHRQFQFAPSWSTEQLSALQQLGLNMDDFHMTQDNGRVVACAALWDQRAFKQTIIRGYMPWLARTRPVINFAARFAGRPCLPEIGSTLDQAFVSHLAVETIQPEALVSTISALQIVATAKGIKFLTLGFASDDPRLKTVSSRFRCREYRSRIYSVCWPEIETSGDLDERCLAPEVALL